MKRNIRMFSFALFGTVCAAVFLFTEKEAPQKAADALQTTLAYFYTMRDYQGQIAVFAGNDEMPLEVFPIFTESLPEADIAKIRSGIKANSAAELQRLIEDYTS